MVSEEDVDLYARMSLDEFSYDFSFGDTGGYKRVAIVEINDKDGLCMNGKYYGCIFRSSKKMIIVAGTGFVTKSLTDEQYEEFLKTGLLERDEKWIAKLLTKSDIF